MADKTINLIYKILGIDKANRETRKLDSNLDALAKRALQVGGAFFTAQGIIKGLTFIANQAKASQRINDLENAMLNLGREAGFTSQTLDKLREATDNTVSSADLLTSANTALLLGIVDNDDEMAQLLDTAQRLGKAMGVDTAFAVNSLTVGLGRQSRLMLDNLGIMVDVGSANKAFAEQAGVAVRTLTEEQRKRAFLNEAMRQAKTAVDQLGEEQLDLTEKTQQLNVAMEDLGIAVGERMLPAVTESVSFFAESIQGVNNFFNTIDRANNVIFNNRLEFEHLTPEIKKAFEELDAFGTESILNTSAMDEQRAKIIGLVEAYKQEQNALKAKTIEDETARIAQEDLRKEIDAMGSDSMLTLRDGFENTLPKIERFKGEIQNTDETFKLFNDKQQLALMGVEQFGSSLATAVIHGQDLGDAMVSSLKAIASELLAKAGTFALLNLFTGGSIGAITGGGGAGGFGGFLLRGFTGQTSKVNQTININGGLISQSYVKNTLVPALNNARALG